MQLCSALGMIIEKEFPARWEGLVPSLVGLMQQAAQSGNQQALLGAVNATAQVFKIFEYCYYVLFMVGLLMMISVSYCILLLRLYFLHCWKYL